MSTKSEEVVTELQAALVEGNLSAAKALCQKRENKEVVKENPWEIIPTITAHITEDNELQHEDLLATCVDLLKTVTDMCNADDVVLAIHKEIAHTTDETTFTYLLEPLKTSLLKLPPAKPKYAVWCFDAIQSFLKNLPVPNNFNLEEKERIFMDTDSDVHRISSIYKVIYEFYEEIIEHFRGTPLQMILTKYVLQLFGRPVVQLDLRVANNTQSRARIVLENFTRKITSMYDPCKFIKWRKYKPTLDEDIEVKKIALSNFFYLVLAENVVFTPTVYNPTYLFQNGIFFVTELFSQDHQFVIEKGLALSQHLLSSINAPLDYLLLDDPAHCHFCTSLSQVIIYNPLKAYRQNALVILKSYLFKFDVRGRWLIIYNLFNTLNHSGLLGYLTMQYKEMLVEELEKEQLLSEYFRGPNLIALLNKFCYLNKKEKSDLLELADQIIPALNLMRYLTLRDKANVTGFWNHIHVLQENFLEPLKKGLIMSKAHYEFKIKELEEEAAKGDKKEIASKVSVTIGGENLPNMTIGEKMSVLKSSMTAFDVIESILARVNEVIQYNTAVLE